MRFFTILNSPQVECSPMSNLINFVCSWWSFQGSVWVKILIFMFSSSFRNDIEGEPCVDRRNNFHCFFGLFNSLRIGENFSSIYIIFTFEFPSCHLNFDLILIFSSDKRKTWKFLTTFTTNSPLWPCFMFWHQTLFTIRKIFRDIL